MKCIGWCERIMPTATCCPGTGMSQSQRKIQSMSNEGKKLENLKQYSIVLLVFFCGREDLNLGKPFCRCSCP